jgi:hypothetical protein
MKLLDEPIFLGLMHRNRVSLQELAMNLKVASRNPVSSQLCVSPILISFTQLVQNPDTIPVHTAVAS